MNKIITLGREFGSGGRELARRLAEELSIEYYDKEIIAEIAEHTQLSQEYVKNVIENTPHSLFPITIGQTFAYSHDYTIKQMQTIYKAQDEIVKSLAEKSDCIIVGRCADYILRDKDICRIFVHADINSRLERCKERITSGEQFTDKQIINKIKRIDRNRARYYEFYTGQKWGDIKNYDFCINTTNIKIKEITPVIAKLFK